MKTFYFNSGVKPYNSSYLAPGDKFINGEKHHPFICDNVPDNAILKFLCDNPNLEESKNPNILVAPVIGGNMHSKYAYFIINF